MSYDWGTTASHLWSKCFCHFISPLIPVLDSTPPLILVHCSLTVLVLLAILFQTCLPFFSPDSRGLFWHFDFRIVCTIVQWYHHWPPLSKPVFHFISPGVSGSLKNLGLRIMSQFQLSYHCSTLSYPCSSLLPFSLSWCQCLDLNPWS